MMLLGPQTFVPIAWLCKKQGVISHSTTEAETISLDAGLRLEALPILMLWDIVIDTFSTEAEKQALRARNAGGVILGSVELANECRKAVSSSGEGDTFRKDFFFYSEKISFFIPKRFLFIPKRFLLVFRKNVFFQNRRKTMIGVSLLDIPKKFLFPGL